MPDRLLDDRLLQNKSGKAGISGLLFSLTFYSTVAFVFSALLFRLVLNLLTGLLLWIHSLHFQYRLFDIRFFSVDGSKWPFERIQLVFGLGYLLFTLTGIYLFRILHRIRGNWKFRLFLTWMAFLLCYTLPGGIIAGVVFFNDFGIAYQWLIDNIVGRSLIALIVLLIMVITRQPWVFLFLKASPSSLFFQDENYIKLYVENVFIRSWVAGVLILLLFNLPFHDGFWIVNLLSLAVIVFPVIPRPVYFDNLFIRKNEKKIDVPGYAIILVIVLLLLAKFAGTFPVNL